MESLFQSEEWRVEMDYDEIRALKQDIMASMHCALPGTVVSFNAEAQTAVIQPAVSRNSMTKRGTE